MTIISFARNLDKRLRLLVISTGLLLLPQIGQFISLADLAKGHRVSDLAIFFQFAAIFIVPTSLILTGAVLYTYRQTWRDHRPALLLGAMNLLLAINITWFLIEPCSWATAVGLGLTACR